MAFSPEIQQFVDHWFRCFRAVFMCLGPAVCPPSGKDDFGSRHEGGPSHVGLGVDLECAGRIRCKFATLRHVGSIFFSAREYLLKVTLQITDHPKFKSTNDHIHLDHLCHIFRFLCTLRYPCHSRYHESYGHRVFYCEKEGRQRCMV